MSGNYCTATLHAISFLFATYWLTWMFTLFPKYSSFLSWSKDMHVMLTGDYKLAFSVDGTIEYFCHSVSPITAEIGSSLSSLENCCN